MATTSEARALPFFTDLLGQPLSSGFIYIGQAGLDPVAYPAVIHSDIAGTVVVAQPVRTTNGHAAAAGALIHLFVPIPYSITILDSAQRVVYASLQETDPVATAIGTSSVQSASSAADLQARTSGSLNQVWVQGSGLYVFAPLDNISPQNLPFVIVANDGGRYLLDTQYVNALGFRISGQTISATSQGLSLGWNDGGSSGASVLTNNEGGGAGGFLFRNVNSTNTVELGRVTFTPTGGITTTGGISAAAAIQTTAGNITAAGNLVAIGAQVALTADLSKGLQWDAGGARYILPGAPLLLNGSPAQTTATALANQIAHGVGAYTLGTATMPTPGTWALDSNIAGVFLWVRTA